MLNKEDNSGREEGKGYTEVGRERKESKEMTYTEQDFNLLDRFLDDLDRDAWASAPSGLDSITAEAARAAVQVVSTPAGEAEIAEVQSRIWRQVLINSQASNTVPARSETRTPVQETIEDVQSGPTQTNRTIWRQWREWLPWVGSITAKRSLVLTGVAVTLLLAIGILSFTGDPQLVSASEILARAEKVAAQPGALGMRSYAATIKGRNPAGAYFADWEYKAWFKAPDKSRLEMDIIAMDGTPIAQVTPAPQVPHFITTYDGKAAWFRTADGDGKTAQLGDPRSVAFGGPAFGAGDLQSLLNNASEEFDVTLAGTGQVLGRAAYQLELTPRTGNKVVGTQYFSGATAWIDKETYVQLRYETRDLSGAVFLEWEYTSFELNPELDDSLFEYVPGPDVVVQWRVVPPRSEQLRAWRQVAQRSHFQVFMPDYSALPERYVSVGPAVRGTSASTEGVGVEEVYYSRGVPALIICQEPKASDGPQGGTSGSVGGGGSCWGTVTPDSSGGDERVRISADLYGYYSGGQSRSTLSLEKEGVTVVIRSIIGPNQGNTAENVPGPATKEELIKIAASLEPVPLADESTSPSNK